MDRASRSFFSLLGICAVLGAYVACGFAGHVLAPFFGVDGALSGHLAVACILPAIALTLLLGGSIGSALTTLCRQGLASRRLTRRLAADELPAPPALRTAAREAGLEGRVQMVEGGEPFSFVHGILTPRIAISRTFVTELTDAELSATLEHERYHVSHLDPLRALLAKALAGAFFLLPSLERMRARYEQSRELAADRRAELTCGSHALVSSAESSAGAGGDTVVTAPLADPSHLDARISRLETGRAPSASLAERSDLAWSAIGTASFAALFAAAAFGLGGNSALAALAADELGAGGALFCVLCLIPLAGGTILAMRYLSRRASRPLLESSQS